MNELEFLRDEIRYGTTVKNGVREYWGASYAIVLIAMAYGAGEGFMLVDEQF